MEEEEEEEEEGLMETASVRPNLSEFLMKERMQPEEPRCLPFFLVVVSRIGKSSQTPSLTRSEALVMRPTEPCRKNPKSQKAIRRRGL